jgi:hypothetical protein
VGAVALEATPALTKPPPDTKTKLVLKVPPSKAMGLEPRRRSELGGKPTTRTENEELYRSRYKFPMISHFANLPSKLTIGEVAAMSPRFCKRMIRFFTLMGRPRETEVTVRAITSAYYLPVQIQGQSVSALVDTGSVITIMGEKCVKRLGLTASDCPPLVMKLADDSKTIAQQQLDGAVIDIGELHIPARILVIPGVEYDLILGKDFLTATETCLQMKPTCATATLTWLGQEETQKLHSRQDCIGLVETIGQDTDSGVNIDTEDDDMIHAVLQQMFIEEKAQEEQYGHQQPRRTQATCGRSRSLATANMIARLHDEQHGPNSTRGQQEQQQRPPWAGDNNGGGTKPGREETATQRMRSSGDASRQTETTYSSPEETSDTGREEEDTGDIVYTITLAEEISQELTWQ